MSDRSSLSVLVVEDDPAMARLMTHLLERDGYGTVRHVWSGEAALAEAGAAEIILLDQQLPDAKGLDLLPHLLDRASPPSVILITGHGSEMFAAEALRQGAEDYLTKDHTLAELLPRVLERVRRLRVLRAALAEAEADLLKAERLAAIGEMSVRLHHEINNPLMAALAEIELALEAEGVPDHLLSGLGTVKEALLRIRATVRTSAELPRSGAGTLLGRSAETRFHPGTSEAARIVLYVQEHGVSRILARLLDQAGFKVERCLVPSEVPAVAARPGVAAVLVTVGPETEVQFARLAAVDDRRFALITLGSPGAATTQAQADLALPFPFDPATVVEEIIAAVEARRR